MFPVLLKLGPFTAIRSYGVFAVLGSIACIKYFTYHARRKGMDGGLALDLVLYSIVAGFAAARLTHVLFNFNYFSNHIGEAFLIWNGGLVFYGGLIAAVLTGIGFVRAHPQLKMALVADAIAPGIALGHFFGRLGCFFAGCCYGIPCSLPWAVTFTDPQSKAVLNIPLHPTQLYESFGNLGIFFLLNKYDSLKKRDGDVFVAYLFLYAVLRFSIEFFRDDDRGGFIFGLSPSQLTAIAMIIISLFLAWHSKTRQLHKEA